MKDEYKKLMKRFLFQVGSIWTLKNLPGIHSCDKLKRIHDKKNVTYVKETPQHAHDRLKKINKKLKKKNLLQEH